MVSHQKRLFGDSGRKWWELRLEFFQLGGPTLSLWFCIFFSNNMKRINSMSPVAGNFLSFSSSWPISYLSWECRNIPNSSHLWHFWYLKSSKNLDIAKLPQINYHWVKGKVFVTLGMVSFLQSKQQYPSKNNQSSLGSNALTFGQNHKEHVFKPAMMWKGFHGWGLLFCCLEGMLEKVWNLPKKRKETRV